MKENHSNMIKEMKEEINSNFFKIRQIRDPELETPLNGGTYPNLINFSIDEKLRGWLHLFSNME